MKIITGYIGLGPMPTEKYIHSNIREKMEFTSSSNILQRFIPTIQNTIKITYAIQVRINSKISNLRCHSVGIALDVLSGWDGQMWGVVGCCSVMEGFVGKQVRNLLPFSDHSMAVAHLKHCKKKVCSNMFWEGIFFTSKHGFETLKQRPKLLS